jgi:hypothetical protein
MKTLHFVILAIMLFAVTAGMAQTTPTITFNVPLQLASLHPDVSEVRAACCCYDQAGIPVVQTGHSAVLVPDANGNINQTVTVTVQAMAGKDLANAKTYACSLELKAAGSNVFTTPGVGSTVAIELRSKQGTPLVAQVTGNITW